MHWAVWQTQLFHVRQLTWHKIKYPLSLLLHVLVCSAVHNCWCGIQWRRNSNLCLSCAQRSVSSSSLPHTPHPTLCCLSMTPLPQHIVIDSNAVISFNLRVQLVQRGQVHTTHKVNCSSEGVSLATKGEHCMSQYCASYLCWFVVDMHYRVLWRHCSLSSS